MAKMKTPSESQWNTLVDINNAGASGSTRLEMSRRSPQSTLDACLGHGWLRVQSVEGRGLVYTVTDSGRQAINRLVPGYLPAVVL